MGATLTFLTMILQMRMIRISLRSLGRKQHEVSSSSMDNQSRTVLAIAVNVALSATAVAAEDEKVTELGKISVDAQASAYKAEVPSSPKYTELLRDTAQTITVIPSALIQQ